LKKGFFEEVDDKEDGVDEACYFEKDGFQKYSGSSTIIKTHDGDIWIGGENGLNHIVPAKLAKKDMTVPSVFITSIGILDSIYSKPDGKLFNKAVSYTDKVKIKHWQKDISFDFVALHWTTYVMH
jgi:ligand-binding sensor domain-containing protein